jgi:outer membrane protein OmpA-like peptidoglycan-associated protein
MKEPDSSAAIGQQIQVKVLKSNTFTLNSMRLKELSLATLLALPSFKLQRSPMDIEFASGRERCEVKDCLCKVTGASTSYYPPDKTSNRISLFYEEDSDELSAEQQIILESFIERFKGTRHSTSILGYTDGCGGFEYNLDLSKRRANGVKSLIKSYNPSPKVLFFGENSLGHRDESRRVDVIVHSESLFARSIERVAADFYLLDASGSMSIEIWKKIISASKKPGSQVWVTQMTGCYSGQNINLIRPHGGTEIWWAYWKIIDKMKPGQTLLIISDFRSNYKLSHSEWYRLNQKVADSEIQVVTIQI